MQSPLLSERVAPLDHVLRSYSKLAMLLMIPVSLTIFVVVWGVQNLTPLYGERERSPLYLAADERSAGSSSKKLEASTINALVVVAMVLGVTFLMVLLYKCNCMKIIVVWFIASALLIFSLLAWVWIDLVCTKYQIPYDYLGVTFFLWNFAVTGIVSLFYYAPAKMMQSYLVVLSVIMGWMLTRLPEWTTWAILVAVAIYDILAVLCPHGPLQMLVRESQARNEPIPGFVYDSGDGAVIDSRQANRPEDTGHEMQNPIQTLAQAPDTNVARAVPPTRQSPEVPNSSAPSVPALAQSARATVADVEDEEEPDPFEDADGSSPFKLGLGDFIFYSLLVGRAAEFSYVSWMTCYICVINGLVGTLTCLLFLRGKVPALPALPISIFSGAAAYFVTKYSTVPMNYYLSLSAVVI
jgi:presenilin 2